MIIIPKRSEYHFTVLNHTMEARTIHTNNKREISFLFDDKLVSKKDMPDGNILSDDDVVRELVENYCNTKNNMFSDIFKRHTDKVLLETKEYFFQIDYHGIYVDVELKADSDYYYLDFVSNQGKDKFSAKLESENFSDVLEKIRIFMNILDSVNDGISSNITELNNDKVEELISWR